MAEQTREEYIARRRESTLKDISKARTPKALAKLRKNRMELADIYEEDGAHDTALIIRTLDVPMLDTALRASNIIHGTQA